jgi:hypothetical protein
MSFCSVCTVFKNQRSCRCSVKENEGWGSQTAPLMEEPSITAIEAVKRQFRELAEHICAIVPFVKSQAPLGSLESMFAIQVAISVSSGERQEWLIEQLRQMQAAIGRKTSCAFLLVTGDIRPEYVSEAEEGGRE